MIKLNKKINAKIKRRVIKERSNKNRNKIPI